MGRWVGLSKGQNTVVYLRLLDILPLTRERVHIGKVGRTSPLAVVRD